MSDYDWFLDPFKQQMLERLEANDHKSGLDDIDPDYLISKLEEELAELLEALEPVVGDTFGSLSQAQMRRIVHEAADLGNFAAMAAYAASAWLEKADES